MTAKADVVYGSYNLGEFGSVTKKPVRVWTETPEFVESIIPPPETQTVETYEEIGTRFWDPYAAVPRFTGNQKKVKETQEYPIYFGMAVVRDVTAGVGGCLGKIGS